MESKIKIILITLTLILIGIILGVVYKISREKSAVEPVPVQPAQSELMREETLESLTAPADEKKKDENKESAVSPEVLKSLTAPAKKGGVSAPVPQDVLDSLTAPAK